MKYVIIIPDGCADEPQESLGAKTPLQAARTPHMDDVAASGVVGLASNVPLHLPPGSDVANISLLGYDPVENFTGRAPIEAAAQGIQLGPSDWAIRCNLVTVENGVMRDFTADHISTDEAKQLLQSAQEKLAVAAASAPAGVASPGVVGTKFPTPQHLQFVPGVSYRNLLLWRGDKRPAPFSEETRATPPHDLTDQPVAGDLPSGPGGDVLLDLMRGSEALFADHSVNAARRKAGKLPATTVWLWGIGKTPHLPPFAQVYGKTGRMITAVDLLRGLAILVGWEVIEAPGATGYTDTDYASKGRTAIASLDGADVVCVHVEATDEASHEGDTAAKVKALEEIDRHIVGPVLAELRRRGDYRILVSPDHPTPLRTKTHSHGLVPFAICGTGIAADAQRTYDEVAAGASGLRFDPGWRLMRYFIG
jgi:2,3-bisphosphoglycerate-independent phosphoglycerate mutase